LGNLDVVRSLGAQPLAVGESEEPAEAKIRVSGDRTLAADDVTNTRGGHANLLGQPVTRQAHRDHELFPKQLPRRNRVKQPSTLCHSASFL